MDGGGGWAATEITQDGEMEGDEERGGLQTRAQGTVTSPGTIGFSCFQSPVPNAITAALWGQLGNCCCTYFTDAATEAVCPRSCS